MEIGAGVADPQLFWPGIPSDWTQDPNNPSVWNPPPPPPPVANTRPIVPTPPPVVGGSPVPVSQVPPLPVVYWPPVPVLPGTGIVGSPPDWNTNTSWSSTLAHRLNSSQPIVFKERIILVGGDDGATGASPARNSNYTDFIYTEDGVNWKTGGRIPGAQYRTFPVVFTFKDYLYVYGGYNGWADNRVWRSDMYRTKDLVTWELVPWWGAGTDSVLASYSAKIIEYKGSLYALGIASYRNAVIKYDSYEQLCNGSFTSWLIPNTVTIPLGGLSIFTVGQFVIHKDVLGFAFKEGWVLYNFDHTQSYDGWGGFWTTPDGTNWTQAHMGYWKTTEGGVENPYKPTWEKNYALYYGYGAVGCPVISYRDKIYNFGPAGWDTLQNEMYITDEYTGDWKGYNLGKPGYSVPANWNYIPAWPVVFADRLVFVQSRDNYGYATNHVWSSADGLTWAYDAKLLTSGQIQAYKDTLIWRLVFQYMAQLYPALPNTTIEAYILGHFAFDADGTVLTTINWGGIQSGLLSNNYVPSDTISDYMANLEMAYAYYSGWVYNYITPPGTDFFTGEVFTPPPALQAVSLHVAVCEESWQKGEVRCTGAVNERVFQAGERRVAGSHVARFGVAQRATGSTSQEIGVAIPPVRI